MIFIPSQWSKFLSGIISLQLEELNLALLGVYVCWWWIFIVSFTEMLCSWRIFFSCYRILGFVLYIFKKDIISLTVGLYRLWEVIWIIVPLCVMCHFPLCAFKIFLLPLVFSCLSMMSLGIVFFVLILFGVLWASEICTLMPFTKFQKTLAIISSDIFSALTSPSGVPSSHMLNLLILSYRSLALLFIFNLFFSVFQIG